MKSNVTMDDKVQAALESVGVDERAACFILLMSGIAAGTGILGTSILMLATYRSRRAMFKGTEGRQEPSVMGAPVSPQDVSVVMPTKLLRAPPQQHQPISERRRRAQVFTAFFCTFGMCIAVVLHGIISNTLSMDTGLKWESYALLLSAGCCWMVFQAGVLAVQLEPGRGYSWTSFGEAMLSGITPFVADSFDTLKDTMFGGLCFLSDKSGLHVLGGISWAYLLLFHVWLIFSKETRFLAEFFANHFSVFALPTRDLKSAPDGLSCGEKLLAQIGKQLARTKRQLLLVENIPQAWFAIMFLAMEGGSVVVTLLNLATPALQVLVSWCCYGRVQRRLGRWYIQRLQSAIDDCDEVLIRRLCGEIGEGPELLAVTLDSAIDDGGEVLRRCLCCEIAQSDHLAQAVPLSRCLRAIALASASDEVDRGHVITSFKLDEKSLHIVRECLEAGCRADGVLDLRETGLGNWPALLKEITAFALELPCVAELNLCANRLTADNAMRMAVFLLRARGSPGSLKRLQLGENLLQDCGAEAIIDALPYISGLRELSLSRNQIGDAGARAVAAKLPECPALEYLDMSGNDFGAEAKEGLEKACREHCPKIVLIMH